MTTTARQSRWLFLVNAAVAALGLALLIDTDVDWSSWLRLVLTLLWTTLAVLYLRSWRVLSRSTAVRAGRRGQAGAGEGPSRRRSR